MSHDLDAVTVADGDVQVEKSFDAEGFPVPAVSFVLTSSATTPVVVRLVDHIPESFPMEHVGFHPEYESDRWTAYKDHRVEYERTLHPDEEVQTVYGVRLDDDHDPSDFLAEPTLDRVDEADADEADGAADTINEILGEDRSHMVREVLSGARDAFDDDTDDAGSDATPDAPDGAQSPEQSADVPSFTDDPDPASAGVDDTAVADALASTTPPGDTDSVTSPAPDAAASTGAALDASIGTSPALDATDATADEAPSTAQPTDRPETPESADAEPSVTTASDDSTSEDVSLSEADSTSDASRAEPAAASSVAAALAAELRAGDVDDDDLDVLREELDVGLPTSADVRISRLQSQMEDLQAYSDALAEFLDEEGTGASLVADLTDEMETLEAELAALEDAVSDDDLDALTDDVETLTADLDRLEAQVDEQSARLDDLSAQSDAREAVVDRLDEEIGDVRDDIADLDASIVETQETYDDRVETLTSDVEELQSTVEELEAFRERLSHVFGAQADDE